MTDIEELSTSVANINASIDLANASINDIKENVKSISGNTPPPDNIYEHLLSMWGVQYSLLQGNRAMFSALNVFVAIIVFNLTLSSTFIDSLSQPTKLTLHTALIIGATFFLSGVGYGLCFLWKEAVDARYNNVQVIEEKLLDLKDRDVNIIKCGSEENIPKSHFDLVRTYFKCFWMSIFFIFFCLLLYFLYFILPTILF